MTTLDEISSAFRPTDDTLADIPVTEICDRIPEVRVLLEQIEAVRDRQNSEESLVSVLNEINDRVLRLTDSTGIQDERLQLQMQALLFVRQSQLLADMIEKFPDRDKVTVLNLSQFVLQRAKNAIRGIARADQPTSLASNEI